MTAPIRPPHVGGLRTLAPELTRIVEALARVVEERDHEAQMPAKTAFEGGAQMPENPMFKRGGKSRNGTISET